MTWLLGSLCCWLVVLLVFQRARMTYLKSDAGAANKRLTEALNEDWKLRRKIDELKKLLAERESATAAARNNEETQKAFNARLIGSNNKLQADLTALEKVLTEQQLWAAEHAAELQTAREVADELREQLDAVTDERDRFLNQINAVRMSLA